MPQAMAGCDMGNWPEQYWRMYLQLKDLENFLAQHNVWQGDRMSSLSQCRRYICDGAVRHVCTVAVWRKVEALYPQWAREAREVITIF